ncbi:MAG: hypothetical protein M3P34_06490 [Actinomycetota bacterium]|nr:hypothetical protein [Actinomycetota bacterium]
MNPIVLRPEEPPDDAVVVVRGGEMTGGFVRRTATDAHDELGIYAVSVFLALDADVEELCAAEPYLVRYGKVRLSTVRRLRSGGFPLLPTLDRPHYDVVLPDLDDTTLQRLERCFDPAVPNPARA